MVDDEEAVEDLLAQFPVREADEPITREFLRAEMAELRTEMADQRTELRAEIAELTRSLVTWMIAIAGIGVTMVSVAIAVAALYVGPG